MELEPHLDVWQQKYAAPRPRRLLALDGGGILGIISLEILLEIEQQLAKETGQDSAFRLGDFFDYIGGTSTGSIIAAGLAKGMSVEDLITFYTESGEDMFEREWLINRAYALYEKDPLEKKLKAVLSDRDLGASDLRSLLLIVTRNATTDSPWPLTNNPYAMYNDRRRDNCNLDFPLWEVVRASTAAPVYFPPEDLKIKPGQSAHIFVDGGVTPYNNPAFLLYRMATAPEYRLGWPSGEKEMMLISVGTGSAAKIDPNVDVSGHWVGKNLTMLPGILMGGAAVDQDTNCRALGRCVFGHVLDREVGDMIPRKDGNVVPVDKDLGRHFLYARYDPDVSEDGLAELGQSQIDPSKLKMDSVAHLGEMQAVGKAYAGKHVDVGPFERFWKT